MSATAQRALSCFSDLDHKEKTVVFNILARSLENCDLLKVSESTTDFWDNEEDEAWDNV